MLFSFCFQGNVQADVNTVQSGKIKSGNVTVWEVGNVAKVLADVERLNLNTVNVPIQVDIPNVTSTNMVINQAQKQQAIILIQELLKRNIQVIVEPFPYIQQGMLERQNGTQVTLMISSGIGRRLFCKIFLIPLQVNTMCMD